MYFVSFIRWFAVFVAFIWSIYKISASRSSLHYCGQALPAARCCFLFNIAISNMGQISLWAICMGRSIIYVSLIYRCDLCAVCVLCVCRISVSNSKYFSCSSSSICPIAINAFFILHQIHIVYGKWYEQMSSVKLMKMKLGNWPVTYIVLTRLNIQLSVTRWLHVSLFHKVC